MLNQDFQTAKGSFNEKNPLFPGVVLRFPTFYPMNRIFVFVLLAFGVFFCKPVSAQIITTYAGTTGTAGYSGDNVAAKSSKLNKPYSVALDAGNNVYIADFSNNRVRKVDAVTGIITTIAGNGTASSTGDGFPAVNATLNNPSGIAIDKNGNVYVSEYSGNRVRKISASTGNISTFAGNGTPAFSGDGNLAVNASLKSPFGLAIDTAGNVFIADALNHSIRKVNTSGYITTVAGSSQIAGGGFIDNVAATSGRLNKPYGIAVAPNGDLYIGDNGNNKIRKVTYATGIISTYVSTGLITPYGVALDAGGNVYIADMGNNKIKKVDAVSGVITVIAGTTNGYGGDSTSPTATGTKLSVPMAVAFDSSGNIFIADNGNNRIREIVPFYPSVTIAASQNNVCSGTSVTFTATPTNGGALPTYQWFVNGASVTGNGPTYTFVPNNGDAVSCVLNSFNPYVNPTTAHSDTIVMSVNASLTPSATIAASQNNICSGTQVTYTAMPVNGGTTPSYQWMVNGATMTGSGATFSYAPANGDLISCMLTSSVACASTPTVASDTFTAAVTSSITPSVMIAAAQNNICANTPVIFTATATNGGTTPTYQWQVNGVNAGTNANTFNYTPSNSDVISCVLTSSAGCANPNLAISNAITMTVNPVIPATVSIAASQNNICSGTQVTFTATPGNGGATPAYQWMINGAPVGTNNATFTFAPSNNNVVSCVMTSSATCAGTTPAASNNITMNVTSSVVPQVNITPGVSNICAGTSVLYTAIPSHGGTAPSYQWTVNGVSMGATGTNFSYVPANGDVVNCIMTSSAACAIPAIDTSNNATVTAVAPSTPAVTVTASQNTICAGSLVTYTATPTNGGTYPSYQWKVNGANMGTGTTFNYYPANGDVISCTLTSNAICISTPTAIGKDTADVHAIVIPSVSVTPSQNNLCGNAVVIFTANANNGGNQPTYQWKVNGQSVGSNSSVYSYTPNNNDVITCEMTSNAMCADPNAAHSNSVNMVINQPVTPVATISANPASGATNGQQITFTASATSAGANPQCKWYRNNVLIAGATQSVYIAVAGTDVFNNDEIKATVINTDPCGDTASTNKITVAIIGTTVENVNAGNNELSLFPNPNSGEFTVKGALGNKTKHSVQLEVYNTLGQSVYKETIESTNGSFEHRVSLNGNIPAGNYFLKLNGEGGSNIVRFVVAGK